MTNKELPYESRVQNYFSTFTNVLSTINVKFYKLNKQSAVLPAGKKLPDTLKKIAWFHEFVVSSDAH